MGTPFEFDAATGRAAPCERLDWQDPWALLCGNLTWSGALKGNVSWRD